LISARFQVGQGEKGEEGSQPRVQLGPVVADLRRRCGRRKGMLQRILLRSKIQSRVSDLREIRYFDAAKAVLARQFDTAMETVMRTDHPPPNVLRVAQATQRRRFQLSRRYGLRQLQAFAVLAQAAFDVAAREEEVAAQVVWIRARSAVSP
jgi:hypothetical protein